MDMKLELVVVPVTDVDRAKRFYEGQTPGLHPERLSDGSFASFSDPDGNGWLLQEVEQRSPEREW